MAQLDYVSEIKPRDDSRYENGDQKTMRFWLRILLVDRIALMLMNHEWSRQQTNDLSAICIEWRKRWQHLRVLQSWFRSTVQQGPKFSHKFSSPESFPLSMSFTNMSIFLIVKISDNLWTISDRVPVARIEGLQVACASRLRFRATKESWVLACGWVIRGGKGKSRYWVWRSMQI